MHRQLRANWVLFYLVFISVGCASDKATPPEDVTACEDWRSAYCNAQSSCDSDAGADCRALVDTVPCTSAPDARQCVTTLKTWSSCTSLPTGCDVSSISDRPLVERFCNDYVSKSCDLYAGQCGAYSANVDTCKSTFLPAGSDCTRAIGYSPQFTDCITALLTAGCYPVPLPVCDGAITFLAN